ncbi:MAG TPA: hypothetical protein VGR47_15665 [Terracidiphilus sp.]|nr:hypothetical protein [Terracidiphilus sp.]
MKFKLIIRFAREKDGRWIAEVINMPGVLAYGATKTEAKAKVEKLAREVLEKQTAN